MRTKQPNHPIRTTNHTPTLNRCFRLNKPCRPLGVKPKKRGRKPKHAAIPDLDDGSASIATFGDESSRPGSAFALSPLPGEGAASPLLDMVVDRADPRGFSELYLQVCGRGTFEVGRHNGVRKLLPCEPTAPGRFLDGPAPLRSTRIDLGLYY